MDLVRELTDPHQADFARDGTFSLDGDGALVSVGGVVSGDRAALTTVLADSPCRMGIHVADAEGFIGFVIDITDPKTGGERPTLGERRHRP
jgi:hypothetical protein